MRNDCFPQLNTSVVMKRLNTLNIDVNHLHYIGKTINQRYEIQTTTGLFALDKTQFKTGGSFEYELEFEYIDSTDAFYQLLKQFDIPYQPSLSKLARSVNACKQENNTKSI